MSREDVNLRLNIEQLNLRYPDHDMLTVRESMTVMGYKSVNTAKKHIPFVDGRVSKPALARVMCGR